MKYLQLIRPVNLAMIAGIQLLIKFALFKPFHAVTTLSLVQLGLLCIATLCIAAGGNIINDLYDTTIDRVNKPQKVLVGTAISEKKAVTYYVIVTTLGVGIGFYLSNAIGHSSYAMVFIIMAAVLYLYASYLKTILLVGNLLVSVLVAMSLIVVGIFDLVPVTTPLNQALQGAVFRIVLEYALFAFLLNFIRELVKDLQDINGDKKGGKNTLAIAIGRRRATTVVFVLGVLITLAVVYYMYVFLYAQTLAVLYFLFLVVAPLLYFCIKAFEAEKPKQYAWLSVLLKLVMLTGMGSILLYPFVIL